MLTDGLLQFDSNVAITANNTNQVSSNIIDLGVARDMGVGMANGATPQILCQCTATFTTGSGATLNVQFQGAPDNGSGSPGTWTTFAESGVLPALLTLGQRALQCSVPRPQGSDLANRPRFLRMNYVVGTGSFSAGSLTSEIVLTRDDLPAYAPGFTVNN